MRAVEAAEPEATARFLAIVEPIRRRLRHHPTLRREMIIDTIRRWRCDLPIRFRLSFTVLPDGSVAEDRAIGL
jgi:hypothetical protein